MATNDQDQKLAEDKKKLAADREDREKQMAERAKNQGTPTPTQEEADLLKLGHAVELAPDGSPPDPNTVPAEKKDMAAAGHGGGYATRQAQPAHQTSHRAKE
ncbi:MAG TPA: hypothetical protein VGH47_13355 [Xanthobacteraceae bacterium]|jgi:hypothetical protein